ncbi:LOW QUALITY PROTEIN: neural-cadherin-like [Rhinatrema bivittatum]|uniref:LOW QUALITY PROTEIN: neural-cadherin-like n=1 Tax=Rhinatrema bivittatum TaxID=194408 RepID=UPI00112E79C3|nr:LOW QUALITY PROTEIN: neural-cadherin-like [Rhinatrema bivittatum]
MLSAAGGRAPGMGCVKRRGSPLLLMPPVLLFLLAGCSAGVTGEAATGDPRFSGRMPVAGPLGLRFPLSADAVARSPARPCHRRKDLLQTRDRSGCRSARALRDRDPASYKVSLAAGSGLGEIVFTVPDRRYREKWFEISSPVDPPVRVESGSGRVFLTRKLPGGQSEVLVKVHSLGEGGDWYLCRLTLVVPREESLEWTMYPFPYLARVDPGAQKGSAVYRLGARSYSEDSSSSGIEYLLIEGGEQCFEVDKDTGIIRTSGSALIWNKEYVLTVQATNQRGNKSPYTSVSILAGFRPPQFTNTSYSLLVPESTLQGEKVAVVEAISFLSKALAYSLLMNPSSLFSIHQENGELSLTRAVDYESDHHLYHLLVKALEAESALSSVAEVMVHITDDNDCAPEFLHSIYSCDGIRETIPVGTSLLQVLARDCDSGSNAEISYFIQSAEFSITPQGIISSSKQLDYERANHMYEFVVVAMDKGHPPQTGTASIRIRMENVNDEAPVFSQAIYKTFLSEDAGPSTLVATVHAKDPDGDGVSYMIVGGNEEGNFDLDSQKGIIKLHRSLTLKLKGPQYILNITATDDNSSGGPGPLSSFAQVIVGINDVNNNKPVFRECAQYSESSWVLENQPSGTYVLQVRAYDADLGRNGEVKYGIMLREGTAPGFSIDPDTGVITTTQSFDREKHREYTLSVTATDQAQEPLIGICQITVFVADVNDNDPTFENSRYQFFLREDTSVGTSFLRTAARDDDQGMNAAITYSISQQKPVYFQINPSTGWIYVNQPISQTSRISRYITAMDGGNRSSTVELTVTITNVLNQPPQWEQGEYWVTIPENTIRDTKIVTIKATSPLGDPRVTYNLEEGQVPETNMPVRFYLKPNRADAAASILVAEPLDFEATKFFTLRVRAQNMASVPLASFTTVYVNVTDVNDNVPFFTSSAYEVTVPEGAAAGTSVTRVVATDLDSGSHGKVHYLILKDPSGDYQFFTIDPGTGVIATRTSFDRERKGSYLIEVQSQDSSDSARPGTHGQPNTDTAYVRIFVSDVNDNIPVFPQILYEVSVEEDKDVGYVLLTVTANDEDEGANAKLRYQITAGNEGGVFDVEPEVGAIFITQRLDYERQQRYELRLVASDGRWENQTLVAVSVLNRNDEAPAFTRSEYHGHALEELTELPALVLQVSASDPDQEADQRALRYSLHGQGASTEFAIDEFTGNIYVQKSLDREQRAAWRFLVLATDENGEGMTGFADVMVEVEDVNDNSPVFLCGSDGCFTGYVPEGSPADTTVMEMTAVDHDDPQAGSNARLSYQIIENVHNEVNLNLFSINQYTGTISTVLGSLDREKQDKYLVVVEARDGGGLTGTGTATIVILDINDHAPVFAQNVYTAWVPENTDVNSEITVVSASDRDEGENAMMIFNIIGGDEERKFFIETDKLQKRGIVRLRKKIDYEKSHERTFNLTVKVEDMDFFSLAHCVIYVEDTNDHVPVFYPPFYDITSLTEDVPIGTTVVQLSVVDLDSGLNGRFFYGILDESDPRTPFSVDSEGWIVTVGSLDREAVVQHRLVVFAIDMGQPPLTGSATVLVTLQDVNDNYPELEARYSPVVWENAEFPGIVKMNETSFLLYASDSDTTANGPPFSFRLLGGPDNISSFSLQDLGNGSAALTALRTFDREEQKAFHLPIWISDSGYPPMSSTATLTVTIGDRNDHPHSAGHLDCFVYTYEGVLPTTNLGKVPAPDLDDWEHKTYRFEGKSPRHFILKEHSGLLSIKEGTAPGLYSFQVRVTDGLWPDVVSTVKVLVQEIKAEAAANAGSLWLENITAEEFITRSPDKESKYDILKKLLSEVLPVQLESLHIFSVLDLQHPAQGIHVWFTAAHGSSYYKVEKLNGNVAAFKRKLETALSLHISQVGVDECLNVNCSHGTGCISRTSFKQVPTVVTSGSVSLASVTVQSYALCGCAAREKRYLRCSSYASNPCRNGGTCVDTELGYRCQCPISFHGPECQQTKRTFLGGGYAWFTPSKLCFEGHISLEFITEVADGLLLYDGPVAPLLPREAEDFIALELKNGTPSLTVNHGSGSLLLQLPPGIDVADRRWHSIQILSSAKKVRMILDRCTDASRGEGGDALEEMAKVDRLACDVSGETPGSKRFLDVSQPLQLGGVKDSLPYHKSQTHLKGFVGCIRNLIVDSKLYDLEQAAESLSSVPGCAMTDGHCQSDGVPSCGHHGHCLSDWDTFTCECHPGHTGLKCERELLEGTFEGRSWVHYQLRGLLSTQSTHIQLMVRTRASSGTLLRLASRDGRVHLSLQVTDGHYGVYVSFRKSVHSIMLRTSRVDHGQWVLLSMERHKNVFTLHVNHGRGEREVTGIMGLPGWFVAEAWNVVLGMNLPEHSENGFQGCMRDVRLDGQPLHLDGTSTEFSALLSRHGIGAGCPSDACHGQPCHSPLRCVDIWRKHECRCPVGEVEARDNATGLKLCGPSPCGQWTCRNGGTCVTRALDRFECQCAEGYKGRTCERSLATVGGTLGLSSGSILAISMCFLVFLALLVSYTVWSQWGRARFRKGGIYHIPAEHTSWEDIRENVLNYNEEGGGEHDQNIYNIHELKKPLCTNLTRSSSRTKDRLRKTRSQPKARVHAAVLQEVDSSTGVARMPDFGEYVRHIVWEADNDPKSLPADILHVYSSEGQGSLAGSLSSLDLSNVDEDLNYDYLNEWGLKFDKLKELYQSPPGQA